MKEITVLSYNIADDINMIYVGFIAKGSKIRYTNTFTNIKEVNKYKNSTALLHLGDILMSNQNDTGILISR